MRHDPLNATTDAAETPAANPAPGSAQDAVAASAVVPYPPTPEQFEQLVAERLDTLPESITELLDNVIFVIDDSPLDPAAPLGYYEGVCLAERSDYGYAELPDRIVLCRENLIAHCNSLTELNSEIYITIVHEIAHFYGFEEARVHEMGWG